MIVKKMFSMDKFKAGKFCQVNFVSGKFGQVNFVR